MPLGKRAGEEEQSLQEHLAGPAGPPPGLPGPPPGSGGWVCVYACVCVTVWEEVHL